MYRLLHAQIGILFGLAVIRSRLGRSLAIRPVGPYTLVLARGMLLPRQSDHQRIVPALNLILEPLMMILKTLVRRVLLFDARVLAVFRPRLLNVRRVMMTGRPLRVLAVVLPGNGTGPLRTLRTRSFRILRPLLPKIHGSTGRGPLGTLGALLPEIRRATRNHRRLNPVLVIGRGFCVRSFLQRSSGTGGERFVRSAGPSGRIERLGWMVTRPGGARVRDEEAGEGGQRWPGRLVAQRLRQGRSQRAGRRGGRAVLLMVMVMVVVMLVMKIGHGDRVRRRIVHAAAAEHERVHAHAHVRALRFDALPHEHARAFFRLWPGDSTGFRRDFVTCVSHVITDTASKFQFSYKLLLCPTTR